MTSCQHFLLRACYVHDLNSHPILYRDRFAIARCDLDDLFLNGDWLVLANNLNLSFLNLSVFSDFSTCDFHFTTDNFSQLRVGLLPQLRREICVGYFISVTYDARQNLDRHFSSLTFSRLKSMDLMKSFDQSDRSDSLANQREEFQTFLTHLFRNFFIFSN